MAKLYFKYGAMGSSKTAQALITKFNYEELGMSVWLIKPGTDTRDGVDVIKSRIGLSATAQVIAPEENIIAAYRKAGKHDVIIADEAQFFTPAQIDGLRTLVDEDDLPVLCFGLRTDFLTHFFIVTMIDDTGHTTYNMTFFVKSQPILSFAHFKGMVFRRCQRVAIHRLDLRDIIRVVLVKYIGEMNKLPQVSFSLDLFNRDIHIFCFC